MHALGTVYRSILNFPSEHLLQWLLCNFVCVFVWSETLPSFLWLSVSCWWAHKCCLVVKCPAQAIPLQLVWDRAARAAFILCKIIRPVIQGWLVSHSKAHSSSVLCMRWQDSQAQSVCPRRGLSRSTAFKCHSCHLIQRKGATAKRK